MVNLFENQLKSIPVELTDPDLQKNSSRNALKHGGCAVSTLLMALNLAGKGGVSLALGAASAGTKAAIGRVGNVAGWFLSLEVSLAVRVGLTAAEAVYCASQP